jgi:hypothetical protein
MRDGLHEHRVAGTPIEPGGCPLPAVVGYVLREPSGKGGLNDEHCDN